MLEDLRKNQKSIIWMIAIIFVAGMAVAGIVEVFYPKPFVGKIYGKKINYQEYDRMFRQNVEMHLMQNPETRLDEATTKNLNDQTWNQLVSRTVMDKQIKRYRIRVKDKDVINKFRNDPPQELKQNPSFLTDGVFDQQKYLSAIATDENFAIQLENYIRQLLPYEKLERKIKDQVVVTEDSVRVDWVQKNDKVTGQVISFDWNSIPAQEVSEDEIKAYYNKNRDKYKKEATRKYRYVQLRLEASEDDILRAKEEINYVYSLIQSGTDFGTLAEQYSEDPGSAANKGTLGYFTKGRMVREFEEMAFMLEIGQVSEPFKTNFGWHILMVTGKRNNEQGEPEVEASHILIKIEPSDKTRMDLRNLSETLYELAERNGLQKAAEELSLDSRETNEFFIETEHIPGIGRYPHLVKEAFSKRIGYLVEPLRIHDGSYIVAELSYRKGAHIQDLEQVNDVIKRELDKEKRLTLAKVEAEKIINNYSSEQYFDKAKEYGFKVIDFKDIILTRGLPQIGLDKQLNDELFKKESGEWTSLVKTDKGIYLALVTERNNPNMEIFKRDLEKLTEEYRQRKEQTHYSEWYQRVLKEANVQDLRYLYY